MGSNIAQIGGFDGSAIQVTDPETSRQATGMTVPDDFTPHPNQRTGTSTDLTADANSGDVVTVEVNDASIFEQYDMAVIEDDNTSEEIEQIEAVDEANNTVTVDNLANSYSTADNATIELLDVNWVRIAVENPAHTVQDIGSDLTAGQDVQIPVQDASLFDVGWDVIVAEDDTDAGETAEIVDKDESNDTVTVDSLDSGYQTADTSYIESKFAPSFYPMAGGPKAQSFFRVALSEYPVGKLDKVIDDLGMDVDKSLNKEPKIDAIIRERCREMNAPYQGDGFTSAIESTEV